MQAFTPSVPSGSQRQSLPAITSVKHQTWINDYFKRMADEKTKQAVADDKRRSHHFQVRLDKQLADQLRHYAEQRHHGVINMALNTIISKFFNGK